MPGLVCADPGDPVARVCVVGEHSQQLCKRLACSAEACRHLCGHVWDSGEREKEVSSQSKTERSTEMMQNRKVDESKTLVRGIPQPGVPLQGCPWENL